MEFKTVSIAAHSTWNYCGDHGFAIDAGEGMALALGIGPLAALKNLLITHDHWDHIAGIPMVIRSRQRVPNLPALNIYVPSWSGRYEHMAAMVPGANWQLVVPGDRIALGINNRTELWATPFPVRHGRSGAVGYKLFHSRMRRRAEFAHLSASEMQELALRFRDEGRRPEFSEPFDCHVLTYTGDTRPLPPEALGSPKTLMHEATYPNPAMQEDHDHSVLADAVGAAAAIGAELIVNHLSLRYREVQSDDTPVIPAGVQWVPPANRMHTVRIAW